MKEFECLHCHTILTDTSSASIEQQLSASGQYCEDCIDELDTSVTRYDWLKDEDLQAKFLEWYFTGSNERTFTPEQWINSLDWVEMWHKTDETYNTDVFDSALQRFIVNEYSGHYEKWLMETN
jgi:hypothetical protein